jgi:hypothetical protein
MAHVMGAAMRFPKKETGLDDNLDDIEYFKAHRSHV